MKHPLPEWRNPTHKELVQMFLRRSAYLDIKDEEIRKLRELLRETLTACTSFWRYTNLFIDPVDDEPTVLKFRGIQRKIRRAIKENQP